MRVHLYFLYSCFLHSESEKFLFVKSYHLDLKFSAHVSFRLFWLVHQFLPQLRHEEQGPLEQHSLFIPVAYKYAS